jgi:adenylylsulfate kinase
MTVSNCGHGAVVWITGLSGSGKTTLANEVVEQFREATLPVVKLDGDELREIFGAVDQKAENYSRDKRLELALRYSRLCRSISAQGFIVVISTISLFKSVHEWNRENLQGYFEVFLDVPVEELRRRDPKEVYDRYFSGELCNVAGMDIPVDYPETPDLVYSSYAELPLELLAEKVVSQVRERVSNGTK